MKEVKPKLLLDWSTHQAAKYACFHWHYSKCVPAGKTVKIGVWENNKFIGVVIFSMGPSPNIAKTFKLTPSELAELSRVALTKHKTPVTKIIKIGIKMLKKLCPKLKILVSYADQNQGHKGVIYKAGNWNYCGEYGPKVNWAYKNSGKIIHERNMRQRILDKKNRLSEFRKFPVLPKHKFIIYLRHKHSTDAIDTPVDRGRCNPDHGAPNSNEINKT